MEIELVQTKKREAVYCFRYRLYVEEMGRRQIYADHDRKMIVEPLDKSGYIFAAFQDDQVVGTVRVNYARLSDLEYYPSLYAMDSVGLFHPQRTSITTKLMVSPEFRSKTLAVRLALAAYKQGIRDGIKYDFIDCNPHLVEFFLGLGYRVHKGQIKHTEYGEVVSMILDLEDLDNFERLRSPFRRACAAFYGSMLPV